MAKDGLQIGTVATVGQNIMTIVMVETTLLYNIYNIYNIYNCIYYIKLNL